MKKRYLDRLDRFYESMIYPHTDERFNTKEEIFWYKSCIDFRSPKYSTIDKIRKSLDKIEGFYCDKELRIIVLYMSEENILLAKLEGRYDGS